MIQFQGYPNNVQPNVGDLANAVNKIGQIRQQDCQQLNTLSNSFLTGRRVAKVPTSATDLTGSLIGDFNVTTTYAYFCVNNGSGGAEWVRTAVATF